jgi:(1->4)-alpha-D-glucan 1-alpha-D-glucosylmutase
MNDLSGWVQRIAEALRREIATRAQPPRATYRLQFAPRQMTFRDAAQLVPYLQELGISHLYASPCRKTCTDSPHGYAIVDYGALNPELGSAEDYQALGRALRTAEMGQILDIVPNHMSTAPGENLWWTDVLENGPSSPYASSFDIDWNPVKEELKDRILLPCLGDQYGTVLESGQLRLEYNAGAFVLRCYGTPMPVDPKTYPQVLTRRLDQLQERLPPESPEMAELESILTALAHLPERHQVAPEQVRERQREKELIKKRLGQLTATCPAIAEHVATNVAELNGTVGSPDSFDGLHQLLDAQVYRLAHWKAAGDEINYRRFFDINELAAVCMEDPVVFERSHRLVFEMLAHGDLTGLRIDHIDGLFDPSDYLWRLQHGYLRTLGQQALAALAEQANPSDPAARSAAPQAPLPQWSDLELLVFSALLGSNAKPPLYVVVEKILGPEEPLPKQWPVAGTTGYDFLRSVNGVFVDWNGLPDLTKAFDRFVGRHVDFREVVLESKVAILRVAMSSELQLLAQRLNRLSEQRRRFRDFTLNTLRHALREIVTCFAVYRTYLRPQEITPRDRRFVVRAVAEAKRRNPEIPGGAFDFVRDVLLFEQPTALDPAAARERELFVGRFQQVTSPVMAKGVEDTACYRYFPLASLNEVGDTPAGPPTTVDDFHRDNAVRHGDWPASLLCTTTHDTKRSEDVRARIDVLTELPREWSRMVNRWARLNRRHRREVDGAPAPSRSDEYLYYQTLLGVWPFESPDAAARSQLVARLQAYLEKATREAKLHTSWLNPHADYETAVREFVAATLDDHPKNRFLGEFRAFHKRIARWGLYNALSQVLLKLTSPGVPDIYQGQELWDFSLVDPDNRRPVDFALRQRLLAGLQQELAGGPGARLVLTRRLAGAPTDPCMKLFVTWQTLRFRREHPELFREGDYLPLTASGAKAAHVCAFAWRWQPAAGPACHAVVVVPRLMARLAESLPLGAECVPSSPCGALWGDTCLALPTPTVGPLVNRFTGQPCPAAGETLRVADVLGEFPVALLTDAR